jgi:hypothetical protein
MSPRHPSTPSRRTRRSSLSTSTTEATNSFLPPSIKNSSPSSRSVLRRPSLSSPTAASSPAGSRRTELRPDPTAGLFPLFTLPSLTSSSSPVSSSAPGLEFALTDLHSRRLSWTRLSSTSLRSALKPLRLPTRILPTEISRLNSRRKPHTTL